MSYDGYVSRYLNRPLSRPAARALRGTPVTPNSVTVFTLVLAVATGAMLAAGWHIAGGIAIQAVSVIDGVDGELARLKDMSSKFGHILDAVTDRYADAIILGGMGVYAARFEDLPRPEVIAMLALAGALSVSYSRARIEASLQVEPSDGLFGLASRDVRSLVAAIGAVLGQCYWTLVVLAVMSFLTVAWRLLYMRVRRVGMTPY
ncbi:MAG: CDP-alcohol phosphatidyltransferase family protein [Dehalococcoidia bacterium]|nr:CDP-alcohol phosphatidyltransferase family protein [Dehalococcoidia bacterium]